jgi:hypothetical protein
MGNVCNGLAHPIVWGIFVPGFASDNPNASLVSCGSHAAAPEHFVQFYEREDELLDRLTAFSGSALRAGDSTLVIATPAHLDDLQRRLRGTGVDLTEAILEDRFICLDAETTLARFMVGGWPDGRMFREFLARPLRRAGAGNRRIHAFGEMVALLWERGETSAALELERLWNQAIGEHPMTLLCAYPQKVLGGEFAAAASSICAEHSAAFGLEERLAA